MTALLGKLFDDGSFTEIQKHEDSGITAGFGRVGDFKVYAYIQNIGVKSGAVNKNAAAKMKKIYADAVKYGAPLVAVFNSKGGEIGEGIELIEAYSGIIADCTRLSGVVPLISVVTGQCSGLNASLCRISDIVIMTEEAEMFFTPPFLGGESQKNAADIIVKTAEEAVLIARDLLSVLPPNNLETPSCLDYEQKIELSKVTAFETLNNTTVGFVTLGEKPDADDTAKIARFVNFCDAFSIPVVTIIDNEGFEADVSICDTARLAQIYASATTPKINLIAGKAAGAAFIITGGFGSDFIIAYETAVISPVPVKTAAAFLEMSEGDYIENHAGVRNALKKGYIDMVINPEEARSALITALEAVRSKRVDSPKRKHINLVF
ncbi:MAG: acetyl-CoA carboxylase [Oscillospiraceae bacterium]|jgi:acetyl-CoA carboxylase carboxyltransferase component|nr:acetyl-CoA carboxylase [Oscillospiraceae bacterium]